MKMPRTSAFSTAIRSSNELIHLDPVNYQCLTSVTVGLNYLYKNSKYGRTKHGSGKTDERGKYHPCPGEILARRYKILQILSKQGQSGIILKAQDLYTQTEVTIKVLHIKYYGIGIQEAHLLSTLKSADPYHVSRTVRLLATFKHKQHYCMVFESLRPEPVTELSCFTQTTDVTQKLNSIRKVSVKLLQVLSFLQQQNMIHADLKPENILLKDKKNIDTIRVIDFGNAINHVHQEVSMYYEKFELQTLLYRAPEVMFGIPFGCEVDIWSLGCILVELFLGRPLFLGENKTELIIEIVDILGPLPTEIFQRGKFYKELSQYTSKHTIKDATLEILNQLTDCYDYTFANFLSGLLKLNPDDRLTPLSALQHPFLAPDFNMGVVLTSQGSKDSMFVLKPENYTERPKISPDIKRQNPTSYDLLQLGTTSESCQNIAVVCPFSKSKQGRVSVVPQVSAIHPLNEISSHRQAVISIETAASVQSQSSHWNSSTLSDPHVRRSRFVRNNINIRRNLMHQEEPNDLTDPNIIFTDIQHEQRQHNLQSLANAEPLNDHQNNSQSPYQLLDQTLSVNQSETVSPSTEIYALSTERQSSSEGDLTSASPRKIRRVSGQRNGLNPRIQNPLNQRVEKSPFTPSQISPLSNNRHAHINQAISSEFEHVVSQNREIEETRARHSLGLNRTRHTIKPREQMNSSGSQDVIEVDPTAQTTFDSDPQTIEPINISDNEETERNTSELVPRFILSPNLKEHINPVIVGKDTITRSISPHLTLEEEDVQDVTIIFDGDDSLIHQSSCDVATNNLISPLCSADSSRNSFKRNNQQNHSLCSNKLNPKGTHPQKGVLSGQQTHIQASLCSSSLPSTSNNLTGSLPLVNTNSVSKQSLQTEPNNSEFDTIYSSLAQKNSLPDIDPQPCSSGETIRATSTLKRKKARSVSDSSIKTQTQEPLIKTDSASGRCEPVVEVIKVESLNNDSSLQGVPCSSKGHLLFPLKQEIKQEPRDYQAQSNTMNNSTGNSVSPQKVEQEIKDVKEENVDMALQETIGRRPSSSADRQKCSVMKVKSEIKLEPDKNYFSEGIASNCGELKSGNISDMCSESPTSRVPPMPRKANPQSNRVKHGLEIKIESVKSDVCVSQPSDDTTRRSRASSKALEPNFSGSITPLAMEVDVDTAGSNVYQSKMISETISSPIPPSSRVSQSPRRVSKSFESEEHPQIMKSPRTLTIKQPPAIAPISSPRQFHPKIITSAHGFDSPLLPGREDSSSPESVVFSPQKLKRIENGTIYFEGFDKYISKRELSEKVIKILPETKPKPQRVYSSTESDLSESTASYIKKNIRAKRVQLPRRTHSRTLKQPAKVLHGHQTVASGDYDNAAMSNDHICTGEKTTKATSQYNEFVGGLASKQRNPAGQKTTKRNVQNRVAVKRILKRWKLRKDSIASHLSAEEFSKQHRQPTPQNSDVNQVEESEIYSTEHGNEQRLLGDKDTDIAQEEEDILEDDAAAPNDAGLSPNLQEYSWKLLDRDAQKQILEKEWSKIARANNFFGSQTPQATRGIENPNFIRPRYKNANIDSAQTFQEEHDQMTSYSPKGMPMISMTPDFRDPLVSPVPLNIETSRNYGISVDNMIDTDAIPCTPRVREEIRTLLDQGFELRPVTKTNDFRTKRTEYGSANQNHHIDSIPYSPTQSPYVLTSTPIRNNSSVPTTPQSCTLKLRKVLHSPSQTPLDSPRPQRRQKATGQYLVDSGVGQSTSPKISFNFKKPKSCMSNIKRRQRKSGARESEFGGSTDVTLGEDSSSPEYCISTGSSSSCLQSSETDVAYSPSQEPVLTAARKRKRKVRTKPKIHASAVNTSSTSETDPSSSRNCGSQIRDEMDVEPDVLGTFSQAVTPERQWRKNLRRRDRIPRLDRSDPNVALYGAFVYFAKKLS